MPESWIEDIEIPGHRRRGELLVVLHDPEDSSLVKLPDNPELRKECVDEDNDQYGMPRRKEFRRSSPDYVGIEVERADDVWWGRQGYDPEKHVTVLTFFGPVHGRREELKCLAQYEYRTTTATMLGILHRAWCLYYHVWDIDEAAIAKERIAKDVKAFWKTFVSQRIEEKIYEFEADKNRLDIDLQYYLGAPREIHLDYRIGHLEFLKEPLKRRHDDGVFFRCFRNIHYHRVSLLRGDSHVCVWGVAHNLLIDEPLDFRHHNAEQYEKSLDHTPQQKERELGWF